MIRPASLALGVPIRALALRVRPCRRPLPLSHPRAVEQTPVVNWAAAYHLSLLGPDYDGQPWCPVFGPDQFHFSVEHAMRTDLDQPVIVATMEIDGAPALLLVDGVHRVYRVVTEGIPMFPAQVLTIAETAAIREH
ncbi:hypothetical protein [Streptomyces sp. NPDC050485]|uniref:hypothetical protein n=1 Tax=Streptomyces sp. NPDC050485 TaxID=3365617 RepID=UPI0037A60620